MKTVMGNIHSQKNLRRLENQLNDEQKINLEHLISIFEERFQREELVKLIIENPDLPLGELIEKLCN